MSDTNKADEFDHFFNKLALLVGKPVAVLAYPEGDKTYYRMGILNHASFTSRGDRISLSLGSAEIFSPKLLPGSPKIYAVSAGETGLELVLDGLQ